MIGKICRKALIGLQILLISTPAMIALSHILKIPISAFLLPAGFSTIIFHIFTRITNKQRLPLFLGPSFLIALIVYAVKQSVPSSCGYVTGGFIIVGLVFIITSFLIKTIGLYKFIKLFPPVVVGSMVLSVGIGLASTQSSLLKQTPPDIVGITLGIVLFIYAFVRPLRKYSLFLGVLSGIVYYTLKMGVHATFIQPGSFSSLRIDAPQFEIRYSILFILAGLAAILEHIGDIYAISMVTNKPYYISPGLHNTLAANGMSAFLSSIFPPSGPITYSEAIGAYAMIKDFDPDYAIYAALWAIIIGMVEIITGIKIELPIPVVVSLTFLAFGMISAIGIRIFVENDVNISDTRNFIIISIMLSIASVDIGVPVFKGVSVKGVVISGIVGIILNLILPGREGDENRG